jgi:hypothetical protein
MSLPAYVASLDAVDKAFHGEYVQSGQGFKLDVKDIDSHPEVIGLKNNKEQLLTEKKQAEDKAAPFLALNKTPEQLSAAVAVAVDVEAGKLVKDGKLDEAVAAERARAQSSIDALKKNHGSELQEKATREGFLMGQIKDIVHVAAVKEAIKGENGVEALLFDKLMGETEMVEIGEADKKSFVVRVKDGKDGHRYADSVGSYLTPQQRVQELKKDVENYGGAFKTDKTKGSGASPFQQPTTPGGGADQGVVTGKSKITAGLAALDK